MKSFLLILLTFWCVTVRSEILFSDDFETCNQPSDLLIANGGKWNSVLGEKHVQISTTEHFSGSKSLEMDMPVTSTEFSIGPSRYFSPKRPELHVRSYIKYAPNFYLPVQSSHKGMTFAGSMPGPCIKTPTDGTGFFSFYPPEQRRKQISTWRIVPWFWTHLRLLGGTSGAIAATTGIRLAGCFPGCLLMAGACGYFTRSRTQAFMPCRTSMSL